MASAFEQIKTYLLHFIFMLIAQVLWYYIIMRDPIEQVWMDILAVSLLYAIFWWIFDKYFFKKKDKHDS
ncbi:hypothetical protein EDD68_1185 [Melghiribacillus thermohalophilus]|uniref:Uncharacterized protein n=1 Tax=Melghiribacillus thermohalophilus TaxID=1324956 RepID=A0A4V2V104_9BACI|nr:hypothetical protein [Melghiribacillus thermohalophilus]TCT19322.1 hypothetical protein EDD68_1185 [Melghiribacillus thermohalophilus]